MNSVTVESGKLQNTISYLCLKLFNIYPKFSFYCYYLITEIIYLMCLLSMEGLSGIQKLALF